MIYRRRALQRRLDELRGVLANEAVDSLASRLNRSGPDRMAAMWELVVLHGLSKCGHLQSEVPLVSGRRPDVHFANGTLKLVADVTSVSDEGLDEKNPYLELSERIEEAKNKLKLPLGGLDLRIRNKRESTKRGTRTMLLLPPRGKLQEFVDQRIVPAMREQIAAGTFPLRIEIDDDGVGLEIIIDPKKSPYSYSSFATYDLPTIKDRNPLYSALRAKAEQLRGADGITGIIVGDGDCVALSDRSQDVSTVSAKQIVAEFFRQISSIKFIVLLSVREERQGWATRPPPIRRNVMSLFIREGIDDRLGLEALFSGMIHHFPKPAMMPVNGALRAREDGYELGHHGGFNMSDSMEVRLSLREVTEVLAGLRTLQDEGAQNVVEARKMNRQPNPVQAMILRNLADGRLPNSIKIIKSDEDDNDDWVEIAFGEADPAISPLR